MVHQQRVASLLCLALFGCQQNATNATADIDGAQSTRQMSIVCPNGNYLTTSSTCAPKLPGNTPAPHDIMSDNFADGCVSGVADANHYCTLPTFGAGDCATSDQCAYMVDSNNRAVGCDPTAYTCSVPGCGAGSYVAADGLCYDKVAGDNAPPAVGVAGCVSGELDGDNCAIPASGAGDCWSAAQCTGVSTNQATTMGCMASHHCGPTTCAPGYFATPNGTCDLKYQGWVHPPNEVLGSGPCVSGIHDVNNYCVPPQFGLGDCANTDQCAYVVDENGRQAGCDPTAHTCSVPGCGLGSYVGTDGLCHDKVAAGETAPSTQSGNPADACVSGVLQGVACAPVATGTGDCWSADQCSGTTTTHAITMGCMASHHCGPTACDPGYFATTSGTCDLKYGGWVHPPNSELGQGPCVSGASDVNNYCTPATFGGGDCAVDDQCGYVFANNQPAVLCDLAAHTCSVCQNGTYRTQDNTCGYKIGGGLTAPSDTYGGNPAAGCVSGAIDAESGMCTMPQTSGGDCTMNSQCTGVTAANVDSVWCATTTHTCEISNCVEGSYLANGTCSLCTVCSAGQRVVAACSSTADTSCAACAPGTFSSAAGSDTCTQCPADTYSGDGASECLPCEEGSHALPGSNTCTRCESGTVYNSGSCSECSAGTYAEDGDSTCTQCTAGTFAGAGAASCIACDPGSYSTAGSGGCILCAAGTFASTAGASECLACPPGSRAPNTGSITCAACPEGTYLADGECLTCSSCDPGKRRVQACSSTANTVCEPCTTGTYSPESDSETCSLCPANTFAAVGASSCTACDDGARSEPGSAWCTHCDGGSFYDSGSCTSCTAGSFAADGDSNCTPCAPGSSSSDGATSCIACAPGHHATDASSTTCEICAAGTFAASAGSIVCQACSAGTTSNAGATECTPCADGTFAPSGSATCVACGNCDDANDCTQDVCDAKRGCTHQNTCTTSTDTPAPASADTIGTGALTVSGGCAATGNAPELWLALVMLVIARGWRAGRDVHLR